MYNVYPMSQQFSILWHNNELSGRCIVSTKSQQNTMNEAFEILMHWNDSIVILWGYDTYTCAAIQCEMMRIQYRKNADRKNYGANTQKKVARRHFSNMNRFSVIHAFIVFERLLSMWEGRTQNVSDYFWRTWKSFSLLSLSLSMCGPHDLSMIPICQLFIL